MKSHGKASGTVFGRVDASHSALSEIVPAGDGTKSIVLKSRASRDWLPGVKCQLCHNVPVHKIRIVIMTLLCRVVEVLNYYMGHA